MPAFTPRWARELLDSSAFRIQQEGLSRVWTFLGFTSDLGRDGDWFRATIGTRQVFVQRFGAEIVGFDNICAHRGYPLRLAEKGNGPIRCGFHQWQYDRDGRAIDIPICAMAYGQRPQEVGARLRRIELAMCGTLIFGRFPSRPTAVGLEDWLGDAFPILKAMSHRNRKPLYVEQRVRAHWKLNMHIALDDFHSPSVHPTTLGRHGWLPSLDLLRYYRLGSHSAYLLSDNARCFEDLIEGCRTGTYKSSHFFILHILPNLVVAHVDADHPFWFCNFMQYVPQAIDRTQLRSWSWPAHFGEDIGPIRRATRPLTDLFRRPIYRHYLKRVVQEDISVCERLQEVLADIDRPPLLGALERRIAWFEEALQDLNPNAEPGCSQGADSREAF